MDTGEIGKGKTTQLIAQPAIVSKYTTQAAPGVDTAWSWPSDNENKNALENLWSDDTLNGFRPFHQSAANFFLDDVGYPVYDNDGNFLQFLRLPSPSEIAKAIWNLLSKDIQQSIYDWASKADDASLASIGKAVYDLVKDTLQSVFHIPAFVVRLALGVIIPRVVIWIVTHIADLPVKEKDPVKKDAKKDVKKEPVADKSNDS